MVTVGRTSWGHLCTFFFFALGHLAVSLPEGGAELCAAEGVIYRQIQCGGTFDSALMASSSCL